MSTRGLQYTRLWVNYEPAASWQLFSLSFGACSGSCFGGTQPLGAIVLRFAASLDHLFHDLDALNDKEPFLSACIEPWNHGRQRYGRIHLSQSQAHRLPHYGIEFLTVGFA